jgi:hypothetical protein
MSVVLPDAMRTTTFPTLRGDGDARRQHDPKRDEHITWTPQERPSAPTNSCNKHLQPPNDRAQPLPTEMVTTSTRAMEMWCLRVRRLLHCSGGAVVRRFCDVFSPPTVAVVRLRVRCVRRRVPRAR